jgi:hypothetical protein
MTPLLPIRYVKVRAGKRTSYLLLTTDSRAWLGGVEVAKDGTRLSTMQDGVEIEKLHLIQKSAITAGDVTVTPMRMNLLYGELQTESYARRR